MLSGLVEFRRSYALAENAFTKMCQAARLVGTSSNDTLSGGGGDDTLKGEGGNDVILATSGSNLLLGGTGDDTIDGGTDQDEIKGGSGVDIIQGGDSNDLLFGELDDDQLEGGDGQDIIRGGRGADLVEGGDDNDTLYALGNVRTEIQITQDDFSSLTNGVVPLSPVDGPDTLTGGAGEDLFWIQESDSDQGFGFYRGQQFAVIEDFVGGEDKIRLPGSPADYVTTTYDDDGTAIVYTEDPNIDLSLGLGPVSVGGISLDLPKPTALVAVVEDVSIRNLTDSDFYLYGAATDE